MAHSKRFPFAEGELVEYESEDEWKETTIKSITKNHVFLDCDRCASIDAMRGHIRKGYQCGERVEHTGHIHRYSMGEGVRKVHQVAQTIILGTGAHRAGTG